MKIEPITISASKGHPTDVNLSNTAGPICSATAVPQRFYRQIAAFLVEEGSTAVTDDYCGSFPLLLNDPS